MIDSHLINMFLAGFGIAVAAAVVLVGVYFAISARVAHHGGVGNGRLTAMNPLNPSEEWPTAGTPVMREPAAHEPVVREPALREPALRQPTLRQPTLREPVASEDRELVLR